MTAFEVTSRDKHDARIITRHYSQKDVEAEMARRERSGHTNIDWRGPIPIEPRPNAAEAQPKPGKRGAGR